MAGSDMHSAKRYQWVLAESAGQTALALQELRYKAAATAVEMISAPFAEQAGAPTVAQAEAPFAERAVVQRQVLERFAAGEVLP